MIRDQRHLQGRHRHASPDDVRAFWEAYASASTFVGFPERGYERGIIDTEDTAAAYVSDSRWVADCPFCNGGMAAWPDHERACCLDCGHTFLITFPPPQTWRRAVAALERRNARNRHWFPWRESPEDLERENDEHAVR